MEMRITQVGGGDVSFSLYYPELTFFYFMSGLFLFLIHLYVLCITHHLPLRQDVLPVMLPRPSVPWLRPAVEWLPCLEIRQCRTPCWSALEMSWIRLEISLKKLREPWESQRMRRVSRDWLRSLTILLRFLLFSSFLPHKLFSLHPLHASSLVPQVLG